MASKDDKGSKRGAAAKAGASASKASAKKGSRPSDATTAPKRGRGKPAPVKKPFPVGFAAGVAVLVLALGGILVYAATNVGGGFQDALEKADAKFTGLTVKSNLTQFHIAGDGTRVDYPNRDTLPPMGGNHANTPLWQNCQVYTAPIVNEHAVHSLEHGAVWLTYRTDLPQDQVTVLDNDIMGNPYAMVSPYIGQVAPVMATAWGRQLSAQSASDPQLKKFVETFAPIGGQGPQTREVGAVCSGPVNLPGTVPFVLGGADGQTPVPGPSTGPLVTANGDLPVPSAGPTQLGGAPTPGVSPTGVPAESVSPTASVVAPVAPTTSAAPPQ